MGGTVERKVIDIHSQQERNAIGHMKPNLSEEKETRLRPTNCTT